MNPFFTCKVQQLSAVHWFIDWLKYSTYFLAYHSNLAVALLLSGWGAGKTFDSMLICPQNCFEMTLALVRQTLSEPPSTCHQKVVQSSVAHPQIQTSISGVNSLPVSSVLITPVVQPTTPCTLHQWRTCVPPQEESRSSLSFSIELSFKLIPMELLSTMQVSLVSAWLR